MQLEQHTKSDVLRYVIQSDPRARLIVVNYRGHIAVQEVSEAAKILCVSGLIVVDVAERNLRN